jgi:molybdate transport system substrate-binding protein
MRKSFGFLIAGLALLALTFTGRATEVTVFAAASLSDSLKDIATYYEFNSGDKITFNFGASSTLARQIAAGAPADIFFSADEAKMDGLAQQGLIDPATRQDMLGNSLVVVVGTNSSLQVTSAYDLTNQVFKQIALADPRAVPAGIYAKKWLDNFQLWPLIGPKVVPTENVRAALAAVETGNVEAGVVYATDAGISTMVRVAYQVPAGDAPSIQYPVAAIRQSTNTVALGNFLTYLHSPRATKVFKKYGFIILK